ncbi:MAG: helix-turn-helix transcriptional regulator [Actinobacteria bacterium]|nr:helix-turn-helix transcriptional regulator [Actinomycetota bacterium]
MVATLGQRLRATRIQRGLSQADLAADLVSPSYVSLIESGRRSPEREVLDGLAERLGVSPLYLESGVSAQEINEQRLRMQFAHIARVNGELDQARELYTGLCHATAGEIRTEARWGLAQTHEALGQLDAALTEFDALTEASRAGEPGAPGLLALMIATCRVLRLAGDFARSIEVGESALAEIRALGLDGTEDAITLASTLAGSYRSRGDLFSARRLAAQAIEQAERLGSREAQGNAYWGACTIAMSRGELPLALDLATRSLAMLSESGESRNLAALRVNYGWLLLRSDPPRLDEADDVLAQAHAALTELAFAPTLAACETEMAWAALLRGDPHRAADIASRAQSRCTDRSAVELQSARVVSGLAQVMGGETDAGARLVGAAAGELAALGSGRAAQAWRDLADALIQQGKSDQAIGALQRAADCAGLRSTAIGSTTTTSVGS